MQLIKYRLVYIYNLPTNWSYSEGAGFIAQSLTAYYALFPLGKFTGRGNTVLIHSAAGGVGIYANKLQKTQSLHNREALEVGSKIETFKEREGYDDYIIRDKNFYKNLQEKLKGRNLNLIGMHCGKIFEDSFKSLAPAGRIVVYGSANFAPESDSPNILKLGYQYLTRPKD